VTHAVLAVLVALDEADAPDDDDADDGDDVLAADCEELLVPHAVATAPMPNTPSSPSARRRPIVNPSSMSIRTSCRTSL
jgi:hypothetical protein